MEWHLFQSVALTPVAHRAQAKKYHFLKCREIIVGYDRLPVSEFRRYYGMTGKKMSLCFSLETTTTHLRKILVASRGSSGEHRVSSLSVLSYIFLYSVSGVSPIEFYHGRLNTVLKRSTRMKVFVGNTEEKLEDHIESAFKMKTFCLLSKSPRADESRKHVLWY